MESIFNKVDCVHCRLSGACLPSGLNSEEVVQLETMLKRKRPIKSDEYLFRQEDQSTSLFVVKSGSFRSFIWDIDGGEQTIGFHLPGEWMGLDAFQKSGRYHCSITALETASVCELPLNYLNNLCAKSPKVQAHLLRIIGSQIVSVQDNLLLLGSRSASEKVVTFLLTLSIKYNALGYSSTEFNLSMSRHHIANFLGLSIETVSRQLSYLSKCGAITVKHRGVHIKNLNILKTIGEPCPLSQLSFAI